MRSLLPLLLLAFGPGMASAAPFGASWTHVGETSAVCYARLESISRAALSYVEYGSTTAYGQRTPRSPEPRWAHLHHLTGLAPGRRVHYRLVAVDPVTGAETRGADASFTPAPLPAAIYLPREGDVPPYRLDQPGARYVLKRDV
ncbi:MAG: hypothetical protein QHJ73_04785, partial [Armatimonadota bacterium]|nr:hypothetical protein [Armatimonadota bacterium]